MDIRGCPLIFTPDVVIMLVGEPIEPEVSHVTNNDFQSSLVELATQQSFFFYTNFSFRFMQSFSVTEI